MVPGTIEPEPGLEVDAKAYVFRGTRSYTGEDVVELHFFANEWVSELVMERLLEAGGRAAGPGEFTARAYLNGKLDLSQAEAVNEVIVSSNRFQLSASQRLLSGRLGEATRKIRNEIIQCLSLIEAGLDFSSEDIELIPAEEAADRLGRIGRELEQLGSAGAGYEQVMDLPSVGVAGAPNAGKSTLVNALVGRPRSIVSESAGTTRDVVEAVLDLPRCRCVVFDCAGLMDSPGDVLEELAQQAAVEALRNSTLVVFCVDLCKQQYGQDLAVWRLVESKAAVVVGTKCDRVGGEALERRLAEVGELFDTKPVAISAATGAGLAELRDLIDRRVGRLSAGRSESHDAVVALTARHRQGVREAIEDIRQAAEQVRAGADEVAAMMLRAAHHRLGRLERHEDIEQQVLEQIFSRFCIGK